jgi:hypothetical protein
MINKVIKMQDFPAAHSMDTEWFAIDADGNIGIFDSGEGGAVPTSNNFNPCKIDGVDDLFVEMTKNLANRILPLKNPNKNLSEILTLNEFKKDIDNLSYQIKNTRRSTSIHKPKHLYRTMYGCFLLVRSERVFADLKISAIDNAYGLHFVGEDIIVFVSDCYSHILHELIDEGKILAGKMADIDSHMNLLGLFHYYSNSHTPSPYKLTNSPVYPLRFLDIPESVHPLIQKNKFGSLRFSRTKIIQPIEHMECNTWDTKRWIDIKGQVHDQHPTYENTADRTHKMQNME